MSTISNTSKGFFGKLFGKDHLISLDLTDTGFALNLTKSGAVILNFSDLRDIRTRNYFDKMTPYRETIFTTTAGKTYTIEADPYNGDVQTILKHYAQYQLGQENLPESLDKLNLTLEHLDNGNTTRLENGYLVIFKKGEETRYPLADIQHYKIDAGAGWIGFKFPDKKLYVTIDINSTNNLWLLHQILDTYFDKAGLFK